MTTLGHQLASRSDGQGSAACRTARLALWAGRTAASAGAAGLLDGRKRLGAFSLDNVTGEVTLIGGRPRYRRAPQKRQNRQKQLRRLFLVFLSFLRRAAMG
jgi:hypothetical protein